jgi:biofilm PGA synthesis lipoprotein PgaB
MKCFLLALAAVAAIGAAFIYGYLAKNSTFFGVSVNVVPASGTEARPTGNPAPEAQISVGVPPSDRVWTAGTEEIPVIMYHDVVPRKDVWFDLTTREFERQMHAIKDAGATVVPLSDVVEHLKTGKPLPPKAIALTFDDNTLGIYEHAFPIMQRFGYHSTQFVHTAKVGVKTEKDHCTWNQLREMQDTGLVEIGSHTISHPPDLRALTPDQARAELTESKATIEAEMGQPCRYFAYTEGNGDETTAQMVADAGYESAWNEARAWDAVPCDRLFMARFAPFRLDDILDRWKDDAPRVKSVPAATALRPVTGEAAHDATVAGVPMTISKADWASMSADARLSSRRAGIYAPRVMLDATLSTPAPLGRQWEWVSRPLVVSSASNAYIVGYQPWMGATDNALRILLPDATFAVVGSEQLVRGGEAVEPLDWRRGRRQATFIGWRADGTPVMGETRRAVRREALASALKALGLKEAVLLGR